MSEQEQVTEDFNYIIIAHGFIRGFVVTNGFKWFKPF